MPGPLLYVNDGFPFNEKNIQNGTCPYFVYTAAEYSNFTALTMMTVADAQLVSIGIGTVWAIAWGFRQIRLALSIDESKE